MIIVDFIIIVLKDLIVYPFHIDDRPASESKANNEFVLMNPKSQCCANVVATLG